jgi:hypothetical protein
MTEPQPRGHTAFILAERLLPAPTRIAPDIAGRTLLL